MLTKISLSNFRCFESLECDFAPGMHIFVGPNAQGKTSLLEAVCVLLRLASPRTTRLATAIQHGKNGFALSGYCDGIHMQFYFSAGEKRLLLDGVEQSAPQEYLRIGRVVFISNHDIEIVRGPAEKRRRFLDFLAAQVDANYRRRLQAYERALRSRNLLLKSPHPRWREVAAFNSPLVENGLYLRSVRANLLAQLNPAAGNFQQEMSGQAELLALHYFPGSGDDFAASLEQAAAEDLRLRQTTVGPHRDDFKIDLNGESVDFASEGQQRTMALALKLAQSRLIKQLAGRPPLLLFDDVFGDLDAKRRVALLEMLPEDSQKLVTTTDVRWLSSRPEARMTRINGGTLKEI